MTTTVARHHVYHYKGSGSLPTLVILHGGGDSAGTYLPIMLQVKKIFNEVIAIEAAGHGLSDEPTDTYTFAAHYQSMNEVLDSLIGTERSVIILGNSLGGLTAMKYTIHAPKRVQGLFLLSPMGAPMTQGMLDDLYTAFTPVNMSGVDAFMERIYHHLPTLKRPLMRRLTFAWMTRQAIQDLVESTTTREGVTAEELRRIVQPVHMICGQSDRIMTPNSLDFFRENLPSLTISRPSQLGHCPHLENPKMVVRELKNFVAQLRE